MPSQKTCPARRHAQPEVAPQTFRSPRDTLCFVRERYEFERGTIELWSPRPWLLASRVTGHLQRSAAWQIVEHRGQLLPNVEFLEEFHDWMDMTGYDSASRQELTAHSFEHRNQIKAIHILTDSKIIKMGIAVASIALGDMLKTYARRDGFEGLLDIARAAPPQSRQMLNSERDTIL